MRRAAWMLVAGTLCILAVPGCYPAPPCQPTQQQCYQPGYVTCVPYWCLSGPIAYPLPEPIPPEPKPQKPIPP
jgi:hypothetical protein